MINNLLINNNKLNTDIFSIKLALSSGSSFLYVCRVVVISRDRESVTYIISIWCAYLPRML